MGDKLTPAERAAIAAYTGKVTKLPEGTAMGVGENANIHDFTDWLAEHGLCVVPIPAEQHKDKGRGSLAHQQEAIVGKNASVDSYFDKAA